MVTLTEGPHPGSFIVSESAGPYHTRETATIAFSQTIIPGTVLARNAVAASVTSSAAADAANTGSSGVMTLDVTTPVLDGAKNGQYRVVCIEPGSNAGVFEVFDPNGVSIGRYTVGGAAFAREIKFAISDATDFVPGDAFVVTVGIELADYQYAALDLTEAGDFAKAAAIAIYGVTTPADATAKIAALVRGPSEVRLADLTWPAGITAAQLAEGIRQLEALGIVGR